MHYDYNEKRYVLDVPNECPKCGSELELDVDYDETHLVCSNMYCDYKIDVTDEFKQYEKVSREEGGGDEKNFIL